MKSLLTDILLFSMLLFLFNKNRIKDTPCCGITIDTPTCFDPPFKTKSFKTLEQFNLDSIVLNNSAKITLIQKKIASLKNGTSKKEGIIIDFSKSKYQDFITLLTILTEHKIDKVFIVDDKICYIPTKKYFPHYLVYTYINKVEPRLETIEIK